MNKKWIEYSTEDGERWEIFKDITDIDDDSDYISLLGNRAVYKKTMLPTDVVKDQNHYWRVSQHPSGKICLLLFSVLM